jgi:HEAT repeat protein
MSPQPEPVTEPQSPEELARLVEACRSGPPEEQLAALERFRSLKVPEAVPAVVEALLSENAVVRSTAAGTLGRLGADASDVAGPALMAALDDDESIVRSDAADALGVLGYRPAAERIGALLGSESDAVVRAAAAETLGDIGDAGSVSGLEAALDDPDEAVRGYAASSLGLLGGPRAKDIVDRAHAPGGRSAGPSRAGRSPLPPGGAFRAGRSAGICPLG